MPYMQYGGYVLMWNGEGERWMWKVFNVSGKFMF